MRIIKKEKPRNEENRILLIRKNQDPGEFIQDKKQLAHAKVRMQLQKDQILLNPYDPLEMVLVLDAFDVPKSKRLESARKAAYGAHGILKDLDLTSVLVHNGGVEQEECIAVAEGLALTSYQFRK